MQCIITPNWLLGYNVNKGSPLQLNVYNKVIFGDRSLIELHISSAYDAG